MHRYLHHQPVVVGSNGDHEGSAVEFLHQSPLSAVVFELEGGVEGNIQKCGTSLLIHPMKLHYYPLDLFSKLLIPGL